MSYVVSLVDFTPLPRFDGIPWVQARIDEGETETGPWMLLDTQSLDPVDDDPTQPQSRSFTVENATAESGKWYRVTFVDQTGDQQLPTKPILNMPEDLPAYAPSLSDVGSVTMARTRDANGNVTGTFSAGTNPTASQVNLIVLRVLRDLRPELGNKIPADLVDDARDLLAMRVAMFIELAYFPNEVAQGRSPYGQFKQLFDEKLPRVRRSIEIEEEGGDPSDETDLNSPQYSFPEPTHWLDGRII